MLLLVFGLFVFDFKLTGDFIDNNLFYIMGVLTVVFIPVMQKYLGK